MNNLIPDLGGLKSMLNRFFSRSNEISKMFGTLALAASLTAGTIAKAESSALDPVNDPATKNEQTSANVSVNDLGLMTASGEVLVYQSEKGQILLAVDPSSNSSCLISGLAIKNLLRNLKTIGLTSKQKNQIRAVLLVAQSDPTVEILEELKQVYSKYIPWGQLNWKQCSDLGELSDNSENGIELPSQVAPSFNSAEDFNRQALLVAAPGGGVPAGLRPPTPAPAVTCKSPDIPRQAGFYCYNTYIPVSADGTFLANKRDNVCCHYCGSPKINQNTGYLPDKSRGFCPAAPKPITGLSRTNKPGGSNAPTNRLDPAAKFNNANFKR